jgi:hypothetical protein
MAGRMLRPVRCPAANHSPEGSIFPMNGKMAEEKTFKDNLARRFAKLAVEDTFVSAQMSRNNCLNSSTSSKLR